MNLQSVRWPSTFQALSNRYYRWLWTGSLASSASFQMGAVAQGWLVYELTGSAFLLTVVSAGWSVMMLLLSLYGGVVCDRNDKRAILIYTRLVMAGNMFIIALLILLGRIAVWHLLVNSLISGVLFSFMLPAQQTMAIELVDRRTLLNALSLDSVGMGLMGIVGAALAGWLVDQVGPSGVYLLMGGLYGVTVFAVSHLPSVKRTREVCRSVWQELGEGTRYMRAQPILMGLLVFAIARVLFVMPYTSLMPKFAKEVMGFEGTGLGLLMAAPGFGALIGSLAVASLGDFQRKGRLLFVAAVGTGVALILFATSRFMPAVMGSLALIGVTGNVLMVLNNMLLQTNTDERFRARVMSVYVMMWGMTPFGTLPAGALADRLGVPPIVAVQGALLIALSLFVLWRRPQLRQLS